MANIIEKRKRAKRKWLLTVNAEELKTCAKCKRTLARLEFWCIASLRELPDCPRCRTKRYQKTKTINSSIEQVPSYSDYIKSDEWRKKRKDYWQHGEYHTCYICDDPWINFAGKELHHRTYDRLGREKLDDLVPVCHGCHEKITNRWSSEKKKPYKSRMTLWQITDLVRARHS
jgi:hypothetical protein